MEINEIKINLPVLVNSVKGIVRFKGLTQFATGVWIGVELEKEAGKNDGSVQGIRYFNCAPNYGVFVKQSQCSPIKVDLLKDGFILSDSFNKNSLISNPRSRLSETTQKVEKLETKRYSSVSIKLFYLKLEEIQFQEIHQDR